MAEERVCLSFPVGTLVSFSHLTSPRDFLDHSLPRSCTWLWVPIPWSRSRTGNFVGTRLMVLRCLPMMTGSVLVVFGRLSVMLRTLVFGHFRSSSFRDKSHAESVYDYRRRNSQKISWRSVSLSAVFRTTTCCFIAATCRGPTSANPATGGDPRQLDLPGATIRFAYPADQSMNR